MNRRTQRLIATALVTSGAMTGMWAGVSFFRAQGQEANPAAELPANPNAPAQPNAPPDAANPGQEMALPPDGAPPAGNLPPPPGQDAQIPPEGAEDLQGGPQDIPAGDGTAFRGASDGFIYNPEGLRDPFFPGRGVQPEQPKGPELPLPPTAEPDFDPKDPLQAFELREYRLVAVLWDVRDPKAMVSTPDGKVWTIRQKVRLGRAGAVVAAIRESEIVVVEPNPDGSYVNASTRVISIKK